MILLVNVGKKTMTDMISFNPQEYNPGENFKVEGYGSVDKVFEGKTECITSLHEPFYHTV